MLYKNHKKVDLLKEPLYLKKKDEFEKFLKGRDYVLFKTFDKINVNKTGHVEPDRIRVVPLEVVVPDENGSDDTWIYLDVAPTVLQNGENDYARAKAASNIFVQRVLQVPATKKDKIFFLMYLSTAGRNGWLFPYDEDADAERKYEAIKSKANIDYLLTGEYSPLTEDNMRRIAKSFGIPNVDSLSKSKLVLALKGLVDKAETEGDMSCNVAAFTAAMENDGVTVTKSKVQEAIDSGRIVYDELEGTWFYTDESGAKVKKIVTVDLLVRESKAKRYNTLHTVFLANEKARKELDVILGYVTIEVDFHRYTYSSLKKFAALNNINATGKADELLERVSEFYEANKNSQKIDLTCLTLNQKIGEVFDNKHEDGTGVE